MRLIDADALIELWKGCTFKGDITPIIANAPTIEPEQESFEWCHDCKEYDQEQHCCHRWTKIIRKTVDELKQSVQPEPQWIPCSERLPEDEYVLISKKPSPLSGSKWSVDIAIRMEDPRSRKIQWRDSGFGVIQDDKVLAWMPLPPSYKEGRDEID